MPRPSIGDKAMTDAERQARYRAARAAGTPVIHTPPPTDPRVKSVGRSRARRWHDTGTALTALQAEYGAWLDALPDNLRDGATAEALQAICDLDLTDLQANNPPRGFGRD